MFIIWVKKFAPKRVNISTARSQLQENKKLYKHFSIDRMILQMIDKNIFQAWYTTDLHPDVREKIESFKKMNPEYAYSLSTDEDMDKFVNENYIGAIADAYNRLNIIVAKVDFWRYLVLYKYGGVYLDMDSSIEKPLNQLINDEDEAIITAEGNPVYYVQWALIFSKRHPILRRTIELILDNIKYNRFPNNIHEMTGPSVYTRAINEIHAGLFNNSTIIHREINRKTDRTYKTSSVSYRVFGIDYSPFFNFKHDAVDLLYTGKKHWRQEQKEKNLLK
jgi:mannosyltransferase OCH1-like enzyme